MTAQINDLFRYNSCEYAVVGISEGELFHPGTLKLNPISSCTSCWRGYQAIFGISNSKLILGSLYINLYKEGEDFQRKQGSVINGTEPMVLQGEDDFFNNHYKNLDHYLEYTGGILIADGFIQELYIHMGFHPAWKYKTVIELIFENGILTGEFDRSKKMKKRRQIILDNQDNQEQQQRFNNSIKFIGRPFRTQSHSIRVYSHNN